MAGFFTDGAGAILDGAGRRFDVARHAWGAGPGLKAASPITPGDAVRLALSGGTRRLPVGVIGPNDASAEELALAEAAGAAIASLGLPMNACSLPSVVSSSLRISSESLSKSLSNCGTELVSVTHTSFSGV